jgi:HNH endonuclease
VKHAKDKIRCIYCQQWRALDDYTKAEHVLPQAFGKFRQNFTLNKVVCDRCNQYFGDHLEFFLGRDTLEGQMRFARGVKTPNDFKAVNTDSRMITRNAEGPFAGCYMQRYFSEEKGDIVVAPVPQAGFFLKPQNGYRYFPVKELPSQSELKALGFHKKHPRAIVTLGMDLPAAKAALATRGITFDVKGSEAIEPPPATLECDVEVTVDHTIFRAIAKIAFNYVAFWEKPAFVQQPAFDKLRRYIRWQHSPGFEAVRAVEKAIIANEPIEGLRLDAHLLTVNWTANNTAVIAQVSLFNHMTYLIVLAQGLTGPPPQLTRGHLFYIPDRAIRELTTMRQASRPLQR